MMSEVIWRQQCLCLYSWVQYYLSSSISTVLRSLQHCHKVTHITSVSISHGEAGGACGHVGMHRKGGCEGKMGSSLCSAWSWNFHSKFLSLSKCFGHSGPMACCCHPMTGVGIPGGGSDSEWVACSLVRSAVQTQESWGAAPQGSGVQLRHRPSWFPEQ